MITNASFRTKKLPDDITVAQVAEAAQAAAAAAAAANAASTGTGLNPQTTSSGPVGAHLGSITEEGVNAGDEPTVGSKQSFRLSELVKKKSKPKPAKSSGSNSNRAVVTNNGSIPPAQIEMSAVNLLITDNGSVVNSATTADWMTASNGDAEPASTNNKEEVNELRRRSNEFNGSTAV